MRSDWKRPEFKVVLPSSIRRICLDVCYDGTPFSGFQSQKNKNAVEDYLEEAIFSLTKERVKVFASGRTDSGVHAFSQVCHFDTQSHIPIERFSFAINAHLKTPFIKVMNAIEVDGSFHSRYSALAREYRYYMKFNKNHTVFDNNRILAIPFEANDENLETLNRMASCIKGERDFSYLKLKEDEGKSAKRDIYVSEFFIENNILVYRIVGNAFLYHQVRSIVGTILNTFIKAKTSTSAIENFLKITENKKRENCIFLAPPFGLYFYRTIYDEKEWASLSKEIESGN